MVLNIRTTIEINSSPAHVREVFLELNRLSEWTTGFVKSITPTKQKHPGTIEAGDTLKVVLDGMTFSPVVLGNSPEQFKWRGGINHIARGDHFFRFEPSKITQGATTFVHGEEFAGLMAAAMSIHGAAQKTELGFQGLNEDLKKRVERRR